MSMVALVRIKGFGGQMPHLFLSDFGDTWELCTWNAEISIVQLVCTWMAVCHVYQAGPLRTGPVSLKRMRSSMDLPTRNGWANINSMLMMTTSSPGGWCLTVKRLHINITKRRKSRRRWKPIPSSLNSVCGGPEVIGGATSQACSVTDISGGLFDYSRALLVKL